jgi:hypothetical protein
LGERTAAAATSREVVARIAPSGVAVAIGAAFRVTAHAGPRRRRYVDFANQHAPSLYMIKPQKVQQQSISANSNIVSSVNHRVEHWTYTGVNTLWR